MSATVWKAGVAEIRAVQGLKIVVDCPHCYGTHVHSRTTTGSASVVAGCHGGRTRCREYSIPTVNTGHSERTEAAS